MGGGSKAQCVGYRYYVGMDFGLCHGPIDALLNVKVAGDVAWSGYSTGGSITIDSPNLFGGDSREGGISGVLDLDIGGPSQGQNAYLASVLGADMLPSFRGVCKAVLNQMYMGLNPYLKDWSFRLKRIHTAQDGAIQWYNEKSEIGASQIVHFEANHALDTDPQLTDHKFVLNGMLATDLVQVAVVPGTNSSWRKIFPWYTHFATIGTPSWDFGFHANELYEVTLDTSGVHEAYLGGVPPSSWAQREYLYIWGYNSQERRWDYLWTINTDHYGHVYDDDSYNRISPLPNYPILGALPYGDATKAQLPTIPEWSATFTVEESGTPFSATTYPTRGESVTAAESVGPILVGNGPACTIYLGSDTTRTDDGDMTLEIKVLTGDMNPAHIIRECRTNQDWGMGIGEADIDDGSFMAAADRLYDEGMGISILWSQSTSIDQFISEILRHINAESPVDNTTGKFGLKLIRDDYNPDDLLVLDETNSSIQDFSRVTVADLINEVTVKYWDRVTAADATVTVQNIAMVQVQGGVVATVVEYPGFTNSAIATKAAARDLQVLSSPRTSCTVLANRLASSLNKGDVFKLTSQRYGVAGMVMRITSIDLGDGISNTVKIGCTQDTFSLPDIALVVPPTVISPGGKVPPTAVRYQLGVEAPYFEMVQRYGQDFVDQKLTSAPEVGYMGVAAVRPTADTINARLYTDSGGGFREYETCQFCPSAVLASDVGYLDTTWLIADGVDLDIVRIGSWAQVDDELVAVVELTDSLITVLRGVLDTVPKTHAASGRLYFWDDFLASDSVEYVETDEVDAKLLTVTSSGVLPLADAPVSTVTINGRAARPYPPGDLKLNSGYFPVFISGLSGLSLTFALRNRLSDTAPSRIGFLDGSVTPEDGQFTTVRIYGETGSPIKEQTNISGTSFAYSTSDELSGGGVSLPGTSWTQRGSVLVASDAAASAYFGFSVSLNAAGTILAVGASNRTGGSTGQGGVYIYDWSGSAWVQRGSVLVAADAANYDSFGNGVALNAAGTILAVGAAFWEGSVTDQGGVYIYDWSGSAWVQRGSVLTASDAATTDTFGTRVALNAVGTILAVGAKYWEGAATDQGGVYIYDWSGSAWVQRGSVLTASDAAGDDRFGNGVALNAAGTILAVGSPNWEGSVTDQGGVYIYDWSGSAWVQRGAVLTASDAVITDGYGYSVALDATGVILTVGSFTRGRLYIYDWSGSAWFQRGSVLTASDAATDDNLGSGVAFNADGSILIGGAWRWEGANTNQGGVYVFDFLGSSRLNGSLRIKIGAIRSGIESYQNHELIVQRAGYGFNYGVYYGGL